VVIAIYDNGDRRELIASRFLGTLSGDSATILLEAVMGNRNRKEVECLWESLSEKLRAYFYHWCRDAQEAEDLVQDTFVKAIAAWDSCECLEHRQGWIWRIAAKTRVDWYRRRCRTERAYVRLSDDAVEPATGVPAHDDCDIWKAVERLRQEYKEVVYLRFSGELSYQEIADILDIPVGTVRSRLHRLLSELRASIETQK